jgi:hypothetical protein
MTIQPQLLDGYSFVGRCPVCGAIGFAIAMSRVEDTGPEIAALKSEGFKLEWVTSATVRGGKWGKCKHMKLADEFREKVRRHPMDTEYGESAVEHWIDFWTNLIEEEEGTETMQGNDAARSRQQAIAGIDFSDGVRAIVAERLRQIEEEGWTVNHDDHWKSGQLAKAAACYATYPEHIFIQYKNAGGAIEFRDPWPWEPRFDKRPAGESRRRLLVMAGALIAAEIDRLDRERSAVMAQANADATESLP